MPIIILLGVIWFLCYVWFNQHEILGRSSGGETFTNRWATKIFFDADDPKDWDDYKGQDRVKEFIRLRLGVLPPDEGLKLMLIASKGAGKTTLFRIIGSKLQEKRGGNYIEVTPAMLKTKVAVDNLMASLGPKDIICIDEIHMLSRQIADTLLPAIEDNVYPFDTGMRSLPSGISWIGATTDVGLLPEAFRDRFHIASLEKLKPEHMSAIISSLNYPINGEAAQEIAKRTLGSPRELKKIFRTARDYAVHTNKTIIDRTTVEKTFRLLDLDENGLYSHDRSVLEALAKNPKFYAPRANGFRPKRFAQSERAIRAITGMDEALYRDEVEPKLIQSGLITIGSGGRELTEKAFRLYFPNMER